MSWDAPGTLERERRPRGRVPRWLAWADLRGRDPEISVIVAFVALACLGWAIAAIPLAIAGMLGALTTAALYVWQLYCLSGVSYKRTLSESRASFGDDVVLELELVNDKLLPLSWLQVDDTVPACLPIESATVVSGGRNAWSNTLVQIRPLLPYQRVRRRFTVRCARRGEHVFGPGSISSGDPVGLRRRSAPAPGEQRLIVFPKVLALEPRSLVSRVLVGEHRTRRELLEDPSRAAGVRAYRPGDPLRNVHWRASARTGSLLVREFDPTVSLRVALFLDLAVPRRRSWATTTPELEFTIAVAASVLVELDRMKVPTGLYASATLDDRPLALPASTTSGLGEMLEALARMSDRPGVSFSGALTTQAGRLHHGTSVIAIANDFSGPTVEALAELRRRHAVTALKIEAGEGFAPPPGTVDALVHVPYDEGWEHLEILELAA